MKVLVIYTGGTIGMVKDLENNSLKPGSISAIKNFVSSEFPSEKINYISTQKEIDSSNFDLDHYYELSTIVDESYYNYDAFLILMGTDTMSYVSSLLSYCIQGLTKPIVFTGGQFPLSKENSDSKDNLKEALLGILKGEFANEVGLYFHHKWMRAVQTTKVSSVHLDAYSTPNPNLIKVDFSSEEFKVEKNISAQIEIIKLNPFSRQHFFKEILNSETLNGIILEVFGTGNLPEFDENIISLFKEKISKGLRVVVVSQCLRGGVEIGKYQASLTSDFIGFISGGNLTTESVLAKMMYLSTKQLNYQQYRGFFEESIKGE